VADGGGLGRSAVRFEALGPLRVLVDGEPAPLRPGMPRRLLGVLLSRADTALAAATLIDALWPDDPPQHAAKALQTYVHRLRRQLGRAVRIGGDGAERITHSGAGYALHLGGDSFDVPEFAACLEGARRARAAGRLDEAAGHFDRALALWRGQPYADVGPVPLLTPEAERLTESRVQALEERAAVNLDRGRHAEILPELTALAAQYPYREAVCGQLMLALHRSGRHAEALESFRQFRDLLADEVGAEPGPRLLALHQAILRRDPSVDVGRAPAPARRPAQLPPDLSSFAGRAESLDRVLAAYRPDARRPAVVVIDGMPGIGKTTLAVHAGHRLAESLPDGQFFVDLHGYALETPPADPTEALDRLLRAAGTPAAEIPAGLEERVAAWRSRMAGQRALIVLDNASGDDQVRPLLPASPGCVVLVTSRRRLAGLEDATPVSLDPLPAAEARALFSAVTSSTASTVEDSRGVDEVVSLCGGLPLAIRLAASRLLSRPSWRVDDLAGRLRGEQRRLAEMAAGARSVAGAFQLSYDQLDEEHRWLFRVLSLHPGDDFDQRAAAALAGRPEAVVESMLEELVDVHLLFCHRYHRYRYHDLIRVHAADLVGRLDPPEAARAALDRLGEFYLDATIRAMRVFSPADAHRRPPPPGAGADPATFIQAAVWLDEERANIVALATRLAADPDAHFAARTRDLALCLHRFLQTRRHTTQAITLHEAALRAARARGDRSGEAIARHHLGSIHRVAGRHEEGLAHLEAALELLGDDPDLARRARITNDIGSNLYELGRMNEAVERCREGILLARAAGEAIGEVRAMIQMSAILRLLGRRGEATEVADQLAARMDATPDPINKGEIAMVLGFAADSLGRHHVAIERFHEALTLFRDQGYRAGEVHALCGLGAARRAIGRYRVALDFYRDALDIAVQIDDRNGEYEARYGIGETLRIKGDPAGALPHLEQALRLATALRQSDDMAHTRERLGDAYEALGATDTARDHWRAAVTLYRQTGLPDADAVEARLSS
jgi:DNA-binding SARP family transcriptional activator